MQQEIKENLLSLPALLKEKGANKILFVTGEHLIGDEFFLDLLAGIGLPYQIIHPPDGVLQRDAIPAFSSLDTVIAIGGGKAMDYAKGIVYQNKKVSRFIAIPTTAGSGSEATPFAVYYSNTEKISLEAPELLPHIALLDPALLKSLPLSQRAISGADAFSQSIESIWSIGRTEKAGEFSLAALENLLQNLPAFVKGNDQNGNAVLWAAHLAGKAIAITRTTGPHALSYYLTAIHGVPHGQAVALTLPLFFLYNNVEKNKEPLQKIYSALQVQAAQEAFEVCRQFFKNLGLATSLSELQIGDTDLDDWLRSVNHQRFANNPVPFDAVALKRLFQRYL